MPFGNFPGHGKLTRKNQVLAILGPHPPVYSFFLDPYKHSKVIIRSICIHLQEFTAAEGKIVAFFFHDSLFAYTDVNRRDALAQWFADILRSPLSLEYKTWFLNFAQNRFCEPPSNPFLCLHLFHEEDILPILKDNTKEGLENYRKELQQVSNTIVIASSLAKKCPDMEISNFLANACLLSPEMEPFCARKNNKYGVYFVDTHTLSRMKDAGLHVVAIDLGAASTSGVVSSDDLYLQVCFLILKIINF